MIVWILSNEWSDWDDSSFSILGVFEDPAEAMMEADEVDPSTRYEWYDSGEYFSRQGNHGDGFYVTPHEVQK